MLAIAASALWGRLRAVLATLGQFMLRCPLCALCAVLALFSAWCWHGWSKSETRRKADAVAFQQASDQAKQAQAKLRAKERQAYQEKANDADQRYLSRTGDARARTADFVARNRVQPDSRSCPAVALGQAGAAELPEDVSGGAVVVAEADVQRAPEWQAYGLACRDWALTVAE